MRIQLDTAVLCSGGLDGPSGLTLNGQQVLDEEHFYRAIAASFFARGNRSTTLSFSVLRQFASARAAGVHLLTVAGTSPRSGLLQVTVGEGSDTQTLYLADCACEAVAPQLKGRSDRVAFTLKGGLFTTDVPADLPGTVDAGGALVMRRASVPIAAGAESVTVTFSAPLSAVPVVTASISRPSGSAMLSCSVRSDSVTASGFVADLGAPTPDNTYRLDYQAVE